MYQFGVDFDLETSLVQLSVNGSHYRKMLTDCFWPELDTLEVHGTYFQQNGGTCRSDVTISLLRQKLFGLIISRCADVNLSRRWCDLSSLDLFLYLGVYQLRVVIFDGREAVCI